MNDLEQIRNALVIVHTLAIIAIAVVIWLRKPGEDANAAVVALRNEVLGLHAAMNTRQATMEERLRHMPNSEELAELEGTVKTIASQNANQSERLAVMTNQLNRIENYLLNQR